MNFKDKELLIVTWGDAYANLQYYDDDPDRDWTPIIVKDVGWLCEENDETIVLCSALSENGNQRNLSVIPLVNVIDIEVVDFT